MQPPPSPSSSSTVRRGSLRLRLPVLLGLPLVINALVMRYLSPGPSPCPCACHYDSTIPPSTTSRIDPTHEVMCVHMQSAIRKSLATLRHLISSIASAAPIYLVSKVRTRTPCQACLGVEAGTERSQHSMSDERGVPPPHRIVGACIISLRWTQGA